MRERKNSGGRAASVEQDVEGRSAEDAIRFLLMAKVWDQYFIPTKGRPLLREAMILCTVPPFYCCCSFSGS